MASTESFDAVEAMTVHDRREPGSSPSWTSRSVLIARPDQRAADGDAPDPDAVTDLHLDHVLTAMAAGRAEYSLDEFFLAPLRDVEAVRYRHDVLRDLEKADVREPILSLSGAMRRMREHFEQVEKLRHALQKQAWFLDAVAIYCDAVRAFSDELAGCDLGSQGLRGLREYLAEYVASDAFGALAAETRALQEALGAVRYVLRIRGGRVTVSRDEGEADYGAEIAETFAKFKQGAVKSYLVKLPDFADMDHVEERIVDLVARLFPDVFRTLRDHCMRHHDYLDATVMAFEREVQFYLGYLELVDRLRAAGLPFCYPEVSASSKDIAVEDGFDLALAIALVPQRPVVCNDLSLSGPEQAFVVTGPNNGGKTTFARMVGELHYLAALGLLVPARRARLFLPDRIFTHFEREEDIQTLHGKLEDELLRVHEILGRATSDSIIVMNESFSSTTLADALLLGTEVMTRILELGSLAVYVTFVDELASLSDGTVSMVAAIDPENPAGRTFAIVRRPADGLAYAWAIAQKYGLTYERLVERIA